MITKIFPFLLWFRGYDRKAFHADFVSGITVGLVLIPQSMAYAQLAGLPAYYGMYAAFLPPMIASLFGSSRQLATGPVAVVSLMTATALEPLATAGSASFIAYAVMLALAVGVFQLLLGILRFGLLVNFLSHPVINGFTNAAAIIIATSQLAKIFGVEVEKAEHHYEMVLRVLQSTWRTTHWPTFSMAALAIIIMVALKRKNSKISGFLVAVVVTTVISWSIGFEHNVQVRIADIHVPEVPALIRDFNIGIKEMQTLGTLRGNINKRLSEIDSDDKEAGQQVRLELRHELALLNLRGDKANQEIGALRTQLRTFHLVVTDNKGEGRIFFREDQLPDGIHPDSRAYRLKVDGSPLNEDKLTLIGGGAVIGNIPRSLPAFGLPQLELNTIAQLLP